MKKLILFAAAAAALASCSETDELAQGKAQSAQGQGEVTFSVYTNRTVSRAGEGGVINLEKLKTTGFGIFGYHTDNTFYDPQASTPDFMYNQEVKWSGSEATGWTYDPVKYWPNEFSTAQSKNTDYVSFFAYAPYVEFDPAKGTAPAGTDAAQQQWKNITSASRNNDKGDPIVRYIVDTNPDTSVDLLWGVAANDAFKGMGNSPTALTTGSTYLNLTKQVGVDDKIQWHFHHALAKLNVQIVAANDVVTAGSTAYDASTGKALHADTRVFLRWIEMTGFAMNGALNLNSGILTEGAVLRPKWKAYNGATDLLSTTVRFNDGLRDGYEGDQNNADPNETVLGQLNPALLEEPTPATGWADKNAGIPTAEYANLFNSTNATDPIFVIPTNGKMKIKLLYDIETADKKLGKYLSDGVTPGFTVANEIEQTTDLTIEAGMAYTVKIVVGMESVKVEAELEDWTDTDANTVDVDMPENDGEGGGSATEPAITLSETSGNLVVNETKELTATVTNPVEGTTISWTSSDPAVAEVTPGTDGKVVVTGKAVGTATITATYGTKTATYQVTVTDDVSPSRGTLQGRSNTYTPATKWF